MFMSLSTVTNNNKTVRMGALIGIGVLIDKNTFEGGRLFRRGAYWKEGAKSNHYGICVYVCVPVEGGGRGAMEGLAIKTQNFILQRIMKQINFTYEPSKMALLTISSRSSVDRAPARCLGGHGIPLGTFFVPRSQHAEYFIFHK